MKYNTGHEHLDEATAADKDMTEQEEHTLRTYAEKLEQTYNRISFARFVSFLIFAAGILLMVTEKTWWTWLIALAGAAVFVLLLIRHSEVSHHQQYVQHRLEVYEYKKKRENGNWHELPNTGKEFITEEDYVAKDLDVFGTHSLYQMICTAHTPAGKQRLAEVLRQAERGKTGVAEIMDRQQAIRELAEHRNFRINFETLALMQEQEDAGINAAQEPLEKDMKEKTSGGFLFLSVLAYAWPLLIILSLLGAIAHWWGSGAILIIYFLGLLLSWVTADSCQKRTSAVFANRTALQSNVYLMEALAQESFTSDLLVRLKGKAWSEDKKNALSGMKKLERLLAAHNIRYNPIIHFLLSGICLYDIHLTRCAVRWERDYGSCVKDSIEVLAEIDMLNSFATLATMRSVCYPVICGQEKKPYIHMQKGYHPLLAPAQAVPNSIRLDAKPRVITGSNMSGKTTFLRTIGMNAILAYAGAPVCAEYMEISLMRPFTSMRITDDVQHGISTFYAEILRIKEMAEYSKQGQPMLCLIDEIFKGTNSADRIVGAEAVIRRLTAAHILCIISTHDFELCRLADNYHFEESYNEEGIQFDYCLREGMCKTTNALHLLKLAGLAEDE